MLAVALFPLVLALRCPQVPDEKVREAGGVTLRYYELSDKDADAIVSSIKVAREMLAKSFSLEVKIDPQVTLREHPGAHRLYWTDGEDRIFLDFPSNEFFLFSQVADERIIRFVLPAITQLWLSKSLTSMAGLDPRILESIAEYADFFYRSYLLPTKEPPAPPTGPGRVWYDLDQVYKGTTMFILNSLAAQKLPAHMLGEFFRTTAFAATEDEHVKKLFDGISPPIPLLAEKDVEPGQVLKATMQSAPTKGAPPTTTEVETILRHSRITLFNGVRIYETVGPAIAPADRQQEFEYIFDLATRIAPDGKVADVPPVVRGLDVWKLYFEFRHRVVRARDDVDYMMVVREFLSRFADHHMNIGPSQTTPLPPGSPVFRSVVGLSFTQIGSGIFVKKVTPDTEPGKAGITAGMELLTVDGRPASDTLDTLATYLRTFFSMPSTQYARIVAMSVILSGAEDKPAELQFASPTGPKSFTFRRGPPPPPKATSSVESTLRPDSIGVVTVSSFDADVLPRFAAAIDDLAKKGAKAIIVDLRGNDGQRTGPVRTGPLGIAALNRLMPKDMQKTAIAGELLRAPESFDKTTINEIVMQPQPGAGAFTGPIAVLVDAATGGEAELFAMGVAATKRGLIIGGRTGGNVTVPKEPEPFQQLKRSRMTLVYPRSALVRPGGEPMQGIGLLPNIDVTPTPDDLAAGRDAALEKAVEKLH